MRAGDEAAIRVGDHPFAIPASAARKARRLHIRERQIDAARALDRVERQLGDLDVRHGFRGAAWL